MAEHGIELKPEIRHPVGDDWETEQQFEDAARLLQISSLELDAAQPQQEPVHRFDPPDSQTLRALIANEPTIEISPGRRRRCGSWIVWLILPPSAMALACGAVMAGASIVNGRQLLWDLGLPLALFGQLGLVLGWLLHLQRAVRADAAEAARLDEVSRRLAEACRSSQAAATFDSMNTLSPAAGYCFGRRRSSAALPGGRRFDPSGRNYVETQ